MSREVRRVAPGWQHPRRADGRHVPLFEAWSLAVHLADRKKYPDEYEDPPDPADYMPAWPESEATYYQMYETTSEGTPISPPLPTPEALARWLVDNGASTFADMTTNYEGWLRMILAGSSVASFMITERGEFVSGVDAVRDDDEKDGAR